VPRDFVVLGFTSENPMFFAVNPALGVNTLPELIALAKKKPDSISYATTGVGRLTHLTGELFQMRADIKLLLVPYTGGPSRAVSDVGTGRVDFIIEGYSGVAAAVKRLPEFPDLPTVAETLPDFAATGWQVMVAPNGTPDPILRKVSRDTAIVAEDPAVKENLAKLGSYSHAMTAADAFAFVHQQQAMWRPVMERIAAKPK
jgi:tripartite-type tricarboxylate transporter receptor subunit TctC